MCNGTDDVDPGGMEECGKIKTSSTYDETIVSARDGGLFGDDVDENASPAELAEAHLKMKSTEALARCFKNKLPSSRQKVETQRTSQFGTVPCQIIRRACHVIQRSNDASCKID